jgi:hypothetical protein
MNWNNYITNYNWYLVIQNELEQLHYKLQLVIQNELKQLHYKLQLVIGD